MNVHDAVHVPFVNSHVLYQNKLFPESHTHSFPLVLIVHYLFLSRNCCKAEALRAPKNESTTFPFFKIATKGTEVT